jgi:hypothetical protein
MDVEGKAHNLEELAQRLETLERENRELHEAQRLEALEQENRELREALGSGVSAHGLETPQRQPQPTQVKQKTVASSKTVRSLLLGPRNEQAYSRPLVGVLPSYVVGWLLTCAVAAYGSYIDLYLNGGNRREWLWLGAIAALFFGVYGGIRDGSKFVFGRFQYVGLITAIGTAMAMFLASLWIVGSLWGGPGYGQTALEWVTSDLLFPIGAGSVGTWLLFVSGALLGTALQLWISAKEQGGSASTSGAKTQVWLGFAGTVIAALLALIGSLFG